MKVINLAICEKLCGAGVVAKNFGLKSALFWKVDCWKCDKKAKIRIFRVNSRCHGRHGKFECWAAHHLAEIGQSTPPFGWWWRFEPPKIEGVGARALSMLFSPRGSPADFRLLAPPSIVIKLQIHFSNC